MFYKGVYHFFGGSWFCWIFIIPLIYAEILIVFGCGWDMDLGSSPTGMDSVNEFDVYMSGNRYRRARYEQAKKQERLLEEQNRLLRENQRILKNKR